MFPVTPRNPHLSGECLNCPYKDAYGFPPGEGSNYGEQIVMVNLEDMKAWVDGSDTIPHEGCENFTLGPPIVEEKDKIQWLDLGSDDCSARWKGLILHTAYMDSKNRFWWWSVSEVDGDEIDSSNNHTELVRTGAQARELAEAVARSVRRSKDPGEPPPHGPACTCPECLGDDPLHPEE
jgi:hypothetical protein